MNNVIEHASNFSVYKMACCSLLLIYFIPSSNKGYLPLVCVFFSYIYSVCSRLRDKIKVRLCSAEANRCSAMIFLNIFYVISIFTDNYAHSYSVSLVIGLWSLLLVEVHLVRSKIYLKAFHLNNFPNNFLIFLRVYVYLTAYTIIVYGFLAVSFLRHSSGFLFILADIIAAIGSLFPALFIVFIRGPYSSSFYYTCQFIVQCSLSASSAVKMAILMSHLFNVTQSITGFITVNIGAAYFFIAARASFLEARRNYKLFTKNETLEKKKNNEGTCTICLETLSHNYVKPYSCTHYFHVECISQWFDHGKACPVCRKRMSIMGFTWLSLYPCFYDRRLYDEDWPPSRACTMETSFLTTVRPFLLSALLIIFAVLFSCGVLLHIFVIFPFAFSLLPHNQWFNTISSAEGLYSSDQVRLRRSRMSSATTPVQSMTIVIWFGNSCLADVVTWIISMAQSLLANCHLSGIFVIENSAYSTEVQL
eukprot:GHVL01033672.1.p1 GENE.GHVL01033672.1~~GHVL01033672.1.p1  ORF type:complete len:477 (-),score=32.14 GHVL01033672.1:730-2160(-)